MKKIILFGSIVLSLLVIALFAAIPSKAAHAQTSCPVGYICTTPTAIYSEYTVDVSKLSTMAKRDAIHQLYLGLQRREPDQQGWDYWTNSSASLSSIMASMKAGTEYTTKIKIAQIYNDVLGRNPTNFELADWYTKVVANAGNTDIVRTGISGGSTSSCYQWATDLGLGSTGADVSALQSWLIANGYHIPNIENGSTARGYFDSQTASAVMAYQTAVGLPATGYVGPLTRAKLNGSCAPTPVVPACPVGNICYPPGVIPSCPAGDTCTPSMTNCPQGYTCYVITPTNPSPLTITSPSAGSVLQVGQTYQIGWTGWNAGVASYTLYLVGGSLGSNGSIYINSVSPSQISPISWTVPSSVVPGANYQIQFSGSGASGANSGSFTITSSATSSAALRVISPNGGETFNLTNQIPVVFVPLSGAININIVDTTADHAYNLATVNGQGGAIQQTAYVSIPSSYNIQPGSQYKIEICGTGCDRSDSTFSLMGNVITTSSRTDQVTQLYVTLQHRQPDAQGLAYWVATPYTIDQMRTLMMQGIEYQTKQKIIAIFATLLPNWTDSDLTFWYQKAAAAGYNTDVVRQGLQGSANASATLSLDAASPLRNTVAVTDPANGQYNGLPVLVFDVSATGGSLHLHEVKAHISSAGTGFPSAAYLYQGATLVTSASVTNGVADFTNITDGTNGAAIPVSTTVPYTLRLDVTGVTSGSVGVTASVSSSDMSIYNVSDSPAPVTGSAAGNTITVVNGPVFTIAGSPTITKTTSPADQSGNSTTTYTSTFNVNVMAVGSDVTLGLSNAAWSAFRTSSDFVQIYKNGVPDSTSRNPVVSYSQPTNTTISSPTSFTVSRNQSVNIPVAYSFVIPNAAASPNTYAMQLNKVAWSTTGQGNQTSLITGGNMTSYANINVTSPYAVVPAVNPTTASIWDAIGSFFGLK